MAAIDQGIVPRSSIPDLGCAIITAPSDSFLIGRPRQDPYIKGKAIIGIEKASLRRWRRCGSSSATWRGGRCRHSRRTRSSVREDPDETTACESSHSQSRYASDNGTSRDLTLRRLRERRLRSHDIWLHRPNRWGCCNGRPGVLSGWKSCNRWCKWLIW